MAPIYVAYFWTKSVKKTQEKGKQNDDLWPKYELEVYSTGRKNFCLKRKRNSCYFEKINTVAENI